MKKYLILLFAATIIFSVFTACNNSEVKSASGKQTGGTSESATDDSINTEGSEASQDYDTQETTEQKHLNDFEVTNGKSKIIDFTPLCQYPDLPTGCEVTSLTMVLNFNGINCDKCEIADNYLDKGEVGTVNFREAFEGDPRDENSFGCYSPVIVKAADRVLNAYGSSLKAVDISGKELSELFTYIDKDIPVIVWGTQDCQPGHYSVTWNVNGEDLTWFTPEHCMVLVGYDSESVWVADPIYGDIISYDKASFESCYNSLFQQAIIIN